MDDETPENEVESDEVEDKRTEFTADGMNPCRQPHKEYNHNKYNDNVFNTTDITQDDGSILLQFNSDTCKVTEDKSVAAGAEYMFLTKTLGRKEGLDKENDTTLDADTSDITELAEYLFLAEQMG